MADELRKEEDLADILLWRMFAYTRSGHDKARERWLAFTRQPDYVACVEKVAETWAGHMESLFGAHSVSRCCDLVLSELRARILVWRLTCANDLQGAGPLSEAELVKEMVITELTVSDQLQRERSRVVAGIKSLLVEWLRDDKTLKRQALLRDWTGEGIAELKKHRYVLQRASAQCGSIAQEAGKVTAVGELQAGYAGSEGSLREQKEEPARDSECPSMVVSKHALFMNRQENQPSAPTINSEQSPTSMWKCFAVPDEPDKHSECDVRELISPEGIHILGARVRGRKHKHEGTNCDDWFELATVGEWSICAVADGGGSYKFSRVGARAACEGSVAYLAKALAGIHIKPREKLEVSMDDEDVRSAKIAVHCGMRAGWASIEKAFEERRTNPEHLKLLQRPGQESREMTLSDLYSTLLLVVHTTIATEGGRRSLVFSCAGGDGMVSAITRAGDCRLLMKPDSGEFGGEVEFLGFKMLTDAGLESRTFPFAGGAKAILLMTDGVADDYFPNSPRMAELYADLVLNGIIRTDSVSEESIVADLQTTKLRDIASIEKTDLLVECERLLAKPEKIQLASAQKYAEALGVDPQDLSKRPGLLAAALRVREQPMPGIPDPKERLLAWLDSYQVRGSFDDRTMIVMLTGGAA